MQPAGTGKRPRGRSAEEQESARGRASRDQEARGETRMRAMVGVPRMTTRGSVARYDSNRLRFVAEHTSMTGKASLADRV